MAEVDRIRDQIVNAYEGGAWHGPSVKEVLEGVTAAQAARRPIAAAHSIWEIVLHVAVWQEIVGRRLTGEPGREVPPEEDFPPVQDTSEAAWAAALDRLATAHAGLLRAMEGVRDDQLDQAPAAQVPRSRYVLLHGAAQHDIYHAGQIAVLRKG